MESFQAFACSADGCAKPAVREHFCENHAAFCDVCGSEQLAGSLTAEGACIECVIDECADELENYPTATCFCGRHGRAA